MKIGIITRTNEKGQIVIPKEVRARLGIDEHVPLNVVVRGQSICLYPISGVISTAEGESSYLKILERTRGAWSGEPWAQIKIKRKNIELTASKQRKHAW